MRLIIAFVVIGSLAAGPHRMFAAEQSSNGKCTELTALRLPDVKVTESVAVAAASSGPDSRGALSRDRRHRHRDPVLAPPAR